MDGIGRVGRAGAALGVAPGADRVRGTGGGFSVPAGDGPAVGGTGAVAPAALDGLLSLQEGEGGWMRDRPARRHADALLEELAALQRKLLSGDPDPAILRRLASLCRAVPAASDPALAAVLRAASLRAAVELARASVS